MSILEQSNPHHSNKMRKRFSHCILLILLWFTCMEIVTLYKGRLASVLVSPPDYEPENLQELLKSGYGIVSDAIKIDSLWDILDPSDSIIHEAKK